jgi:RNA 2',3'-cyclic 3'-phosphodiesterase
VRWTSAANMHVTLSFLGSVDPALRERIEQSLSLVQAPRLRLSLDGVDCFVHAGVMLAKVQPSPALLALAEQVAASLEACGFPRERRPYQPHVTLARSKARISLAASISGNPVFRQAFEAGEFRLYESVTRPDGAQYQVLRAFPLGN